MCARASSGRRSLIAEQPLADAFLDLLVAFVRVAGAQSGALEADSGAHHLQRLAGLLLRAGAAGAFDLVFCDPPYACAARLAAPLAERLPALTSADARIVTESDKRNPLVLPFPLRVERTYGDTRIAIHER